MSSKEYLTIERKNEFRSEYIDGEIVAMTGASRRHNLIVTNLTREISNQLKGKPCELYSNDMRVKVPSARIYTYPDIVVVCGEPKFEDNQFDTLLNPTLIIEVLSESTESYDRGKKFGYYREIEFLSEYVLVDQTEYKIEQYANQTDGRWLFTEARSLDATIQFASISCSLSLKETYDRIDIA